MNQNLHMHHNLPTCVWIPPAETNIPFDVIKQVFRNDFSAAKKALCDVTGSTFCTIGASGRALLYQLLSALYAADNKVRNEVLIPAYTCYSVAAAVVKAGLKIRLYDLDCNTFNPVASSVEQNCSKKTLAILSQHLMGSPSDIWPIVNIASEIGAIHIEDAAQGLGGVLNDRKVGTIGDYGLLSFGRGKPIPLGAGGAIISDQIGLNDLSMAPQVTQGWQKLGIALMGQIIAKPYFYWVAEKLPLGLGKTVFDPDFELGNIPKLLLNLLEPMTTHLKCLQKNRLNVSSVYQEIIPASNLITIPNNSIPAYPRFPVLARSGNLPKKLIRLGVRRLYPKTLNREEEIAPHIENADQYQKGAEIIAEKLISLPTHLAVDIGVAELIGRYLIEWIGK